MSHSNPLRIGLIGCGGIVQKTHLPCLLRLGGAQVVAVADPLPASRNVVADAAGLPASRRFDDYMPMLLAGGIDVALVATPHHLHMPAVTAAVAHGVAVVCEKPMVTDLEGSQRLAADLMASQALFTVVHNFLYSPGILRARTLLRNQTGESPCFGRAQSLFAKEAPLDPLNWRSRSETGGGALNDTCYHEIYLVEALVGSAVVGVQARLKTVYHDISADDLVLLTFEHANGVLSTVTTAWSAPGIEGSFCEVHTDRRTLRVEGRGRGLRTYDRATRTWSEVALGPTDGPGVASGHLAFWQETLRALRAGDPLPIPPAQAQRQIEILEAVRQSSANGGRPVTLSRRSATPAALRTLFS